MGLNVGENIGKWSAPLGDSQITVKNKIGGSFSSEEEARKAAASSKKQAAIVSETDGSYSLFEVNDGATFGNMDKGDDVEVSSHGKALGVINFVGDDGNLVANNEDELRGKANSSSIEDRKT